MSALDVIAEVRAAADMLRGQRCPMIVVVPTGYEHTDLLRASGVEVREITLDTGGLLYVIDPERIDEQWGAGG